jgi:hypothetical protein
MFQRSRQSQSEQVEQVEPPELALLEAQQFALVYTPMEEVGDKRALEADQLLEALALALVAATLPLLLTLIYTQSEGLVREEAEQAAVVEVLQV